MQLARPAFAPHPRLFGRGRVRELAAPILEAPAISDDLKLFASTFRGRLRVRLGPAR